jgi:succinyl-diaminopimelate desuccinylase
VENRRKVLAAIEDLRREIIQFAQQLIRIRSIVSEDQKDVTDFIAAKYRELGLETSLIEDVRTKINVAGHLRQAGSQKSLGYYSHHDTMPIENLSDWEYDPFGAEIVDGKIRGLGACDCKGGIACAVGMVMALRMAGIRLKGDLTLVSCMGETTSYEVGMKSVVRAGRFNVSAAVQGDPAASDLSVDSITTHHFGVIVLEIVIHGEGGHALFPGYGVNAIYKIPAVIEGLMNTKIQSPEFEMYPHRPFIMVDRVVGGGAPGFTPTRSSIAVRVHLLPDQGKEVGLQAIEATLDQLRKRDQELKVEMRVLSWKKGDRVGEWKESRRLYDTMQAVSVELRGEKLKPVCMTTPAMAHYVVQAGIPTFVWGPGRSLYGHAHRANEYLVIDDLLQLTRAYALIAMDYLGYEA